MTLGAYTHQDVPFERVVEELHPLRALNHHPLVQVMILQNVLPHTPMGAALHIETLEISTGTAKFDLTFEFTDMPGGLQGAIEYSTDLFEAETINRMIGHLQCLLEAIVATPERSLSQLRWFSEAEHHQMLEWNTARTPYLAEECIHQIFETQVERIPEAIAVLSATEQLTYRQLNERANQLADHLQKMGVGPEVCVGVCMERSVELVVSLLAILKAGGAYVPLDLSYPQERLSFMLTDAQVAVLLTRTRYLKQLPSVSLSVLCLEQDWSLITQQATSNPSSTVQANNLAYIIYTSGSTGQRKGAAILHTAVIRLVCNTNYINIMPADTLAHLSNIAFDAATFEIWGTLLNGGRLLVIPRDVVLSTHIFANLLHEQNCNVMFVTTALFNQLVQYNPSFFRRLRYVLFGGEAVDVKWVKAALENGPPEHLLHLYGPTENTTFSTWLPSSRYV